MQVFLVFALLIALVAVVFAVQNTALVTISFLVWDFNNSLAILILLTLFAGVLISILMSAPGWIKNRLAQSSLRKKMKELEAELNKVEGKYQAAKQELELYKVPPVPVAPPAEPQPVVPSPAFPEPAIPQYDAETNPFDEPPTAMLPDLDDSTPAQTDTPANEPVKKSKFPGIDRILNR